MLVMTAPITDLAAAVAALGALPMPAGPADSTAAVMPQAAVDAWNRAHPVGTPVVAYPACRPEDCPNDERIVTATRSRATVLGGAAVVWVHGHSACIALSHIDLRTQATDQEAAEMRHWADPALDYTRRQETK